MTKLKMMPLVAMISAGLVGCGGSSGGGGGGGDAPKETIFTFTFAAPNLISEASAKIDSCTIYARREDGNGDKKVLTYQPAVSAQLTGDKVVGFYSDKNGVRQGDLIYPSGTTLKFVLEKIPTDGYFTYQLLDASGTVFTANSFSHDFLKDNNLRNATFSMNREAVSNCNKNGNFSIVSRADLKYEATVSGGLEYNFISQVAQESKPTYSIDSLDVKTVGAKIESTVLVQYKDVAKTELHQYGIRDWSNVSPLPLVGMNDSSPILNPTSFNYDTLEISVLVGDYSYEVAKLPKTTTKFYHPLAPKTETWAYSVSADKPINGWSVALNQKMYEETNWDISVDPSVYYDLNVLPITHLVNSSTIDTGFTFSETDYGFSRIAYRSESNSGGLHRVTHKIFTTLSSEVVVPDLFYYTFDENVKQDLKVSAASDYSQSLVIALPGSDLDSYDFVSLFSHGDITDLKIDHDGLVISEVDIEKVNTDTQKSNFMVLVK
ncbi:54K polar flagellar sheath protein A [Vibrio vulnificus]|nr:54K polar flagellar sheath protein A [Vibrio vulnificus]ELQ2334238.1 54K polar flagellar sheath protein A [Vibrio vulnificus]ELQ2462644.1 54K polar flagellar sheath protein A [Vibrio vulnificus]MCU8471745.1 54K polar flagellar sheath protein A [Vibrio vulnificus]